LSLPDPTKQTAVGVEINANHLKSAKSGFVYGKCTPIKIGRNIQVWETQITNEAGDLICVSRLTTMVIDIK
jgi:1,4-dihydroxy-2-naphthoyl-CoA hydrolase